MTNVSARRAWLAAVASLLFAGLGQLVAGRFLRAVGFQALDMLFALPALATVWYLPMPAAGFPLVFLAAVVWRVWLARDAFRINRVPSAGRARHSRLAWTSAVAGFVVMALALGYVFDELQWRLLGRSFRMPAGAISMAPTLLDGDHLLTRPLQQHPVRRGEMVVFLWPEDTTRSWIKRVVGLPGDTLGMRDGVLQVNGRAQHEDYLLRAERTPNHTGEEFSWQKDHLAGGVQQASAYQPSRDTWGPIVVPEDAYFVLGDNRDNSADSRYWGFVRGELLFARPWRIHFSRDPKTGAVRWQRMGVFLDGSPR